MHDGVPTEASWAAHLLQVSGLAAMPDSPPPAEAMPQVAGVGFDVACWRAALAKSHLPEGVDPQAEGPLHRCDGMQAIEVWTEVELSAMHALWRLARHRSDGTLVARLHRAVAWHLEHTQPDNATNRPWALHVFLREGGPEARHYAATLLHNAQAMAVRPVPLAAWILMDAACELARPLGAPFAG